MTQRTRPGIATTYAGVQFRSRLEAKWACFFDLMGWRWEYEPFDADGYIPDFVLLGDDPVLVEVKPAATRRQLHDAVEKSIDALGGTWHRDLLFVGVTPYLDVEEYGPAGPTYILGLLGEFMPGGRWEPDGPAVPDEWTVAGACWNQCGHCGIATFIHEEQSYRCRLCGHYDGDGYVNQLDDAAEIEQRWARACNAVKWRP